VHRDHPLLQRLGETVRSLRSARGWSRRELARQTGISVRFLADVEGGTANPSLLRLLDLSRALGTDLPALLSGFGGSAGSRRRAVALLGLRGAGKSTVGPLLAARLACPFCELDADVEQQTGLQLGELFQLHGEAYYRTAERQALEQLLVTAPECVIAVGGGLVTEPATFALLRGHAVTVWLRATPEEHWQRVLAQGDTRPMADNERAFADLRRILAVREPMYQRADLTVATSGRTPEAVAEAVLQALAAERGRISKGQ
jgi:XRE family aerobic/anaerobic benzoate catabolism transcriptional regulator